MRKNLKLSMMALGLLAGGVLSSCSVEDTPSLNETGSMLAKAPNVQVYSGSGSTKTYWDPFRGTRGTDVNGNLWYQNWDRPTNVTPEEIERVLEEASKPRPNAVNDIHIDWNNYWVQQVYTGEQTYKDGNGDDIGTGSSHMNHLLAYTDKVKEQTEWYPEEKFVLRDKYGYEDVYEHVNNFNQGANSTVYTDDVTGEEFIGTTLMTDMYADGIDNQFGYHNSTDSKNHYEYIILEIDGEYYICFDFYATHPEGQDANKNMDVGRDWVFNDWIVKITPAYPKGTTPEVTDPNEPGDVVTDPCPECGDSLSHHHDGICSDCVESGRNGTCTTNGGSGQITPNPDGDNGDDDNNGDGTPDIAVPGHNHTNEVEVNLHGTDKGDFLESHLSIHVRAATDVEIFIPVPKEYYVEADDMAIVMQHEENHMYHGETFETRWALKDSDLEVTLMISYEEDGIHITTDGITQEVIDWCMEKCQDGITFEIWNYFDPEVIDLDTLKKYLNQATIRFLDEEPDVYINAFTEENGERNPDDCKVGIEKDQRADYGAPHSGGHYNKSEKNVFYEKNGTTPEPPTY